MNFQRQADKVRKDKAGGGFTLIEVMIALGILAFGILAIASMQSTSLSGTFRARNVTGASTVGQDRIEILMGIPYDDPDLASGAHTPETVTIGNYTYDVGWTVSDDQPIDNTKTIDVTVQWQEKGVQKTLSLVYIKMDVI